MQFRHCLRDMTSHLGSKTSIAVVELYDEGAPEIAHHAFLVHYFPYGCRDYLLHNTVSQKLMLLHPVRSWQWIRSGVTTLTKKRYHNRRNRIPRYRCEICGLRVCINCICVQAIIHVTNQNRWCVASRATSSKGTPIDSPGAKPTFAAHKSNCQFPPPPPRSTETTNPNASTQPGSSPQQRATCWLRSPRALAHSNPWQLLQI